MGPLATAYTLATLAMFLVCAIARNCTDDADRVARAAAWLAFGVGISRIVSALVPAPWSMAHYPAQDLFMLAMCLGWYQVRREWWAAALAACFAVQLYMHAAFWWAGDATQTLSYITENNAVFIAELLIATVAGGRYVVAGVVARLSLPRRWNRLGLAYGEAS
jgi:hypothetical protein